MPKTMLEKQMDAATDAHLGGPRWATLNGFPLYPLWVREPVCAQCSAPVAGMNVVFCDKHRAHADAFIAERDAK